MNSARIVRGQLRDLGLDLAGQGGDIGLPGCAYAIPPGRLERRRVAEL